MKILLMLIGIANFIVGGIYNNLESLVIGGFLMIMMIQFGLEEKLDEYIKIERNK